MLFVTAFSTHTSNIESKTIMEKLNFKIRLANILALKEALSIKPEKTLEDFKVEPWQITLQ